MSSALDTPEVHERGSLAWEPRRQLSLAQARRHTRLMRSFRYGFIGLAALSGGSVVAFALIHSLAQGAPTATAVRSEDAIELIRPRFIGRDAKGREYAVTAESAVRKLGETTVVELDRPAFQNALGQSMTAPQGEYDTANRVLALEGGVVFSDGEGDRFETPSARIDVTAARVTGERGLSGGGPLGAVRADAYEIAGEARRVSLRGNVRGEIKGSPETQ